MWMEHDGSWWVAMWFSMIVFWTVLVAGIWALFASVRRDNRESSADQILERRLARGEISREQYRALRRELHQH